MPEHNGNSKASANIPPYMPGGGNASAPGAPTTFGGAQPQVDPFTIESLRTSVTDVLFVCLFFVIVWIFHFKYSRMYQNGPEDQQQAKTFHLNLDLFLRYTTLFVLLNVVLKVYHPGLSRTFVASGIYHSAYMLHSLMASR